MNFDELIAFAEQLPANDERVDAIRDELATSDADAAAMRDAAVDAFNAAYNDGEYDLGDAALMELLADITEAAREVADVAPEPEKAMSARDRIAELSRRVHGDKENRREKEGTHVSDQTRPGAAEENPEASQTSEADQAEEEGGESAPRDDREREGLRGKSRASDRKREEGTRQGEVTASSRQRVTLSSSELNAQRTQQLPDQRAVKRRFTITASADVPDAPMGKTLSMRDLASVAKSRMQSMPVGQQTEGELRRAIAQINREVAPEYVIDGTNPMVDAETIDRVADEKRLPGGSLVAAALQQMHQANNLTADGSGLQAWTTPPGDIWCSPSETDYTLCEPLATRTGILDLPSLQVRRGGIRYPVWKQYPDFHRPYEHGPGDQESSNDEPQGWWKTHNPPEDYPYDAPYVSDGPRHDWHGYVHANQNNIGATPDLHDPDYFLKHPKKMISGPCVEWAEERMHLAYLWIEEDILRNHTYEELAERFLSDAMVSHAHFMNEIYLKWIVAHSDRLDPFWAGAPGWWGPPGHDKKPLNGIIPPGPQSYPIPVSTNNYYPGSALDFGSYGLFGMGSAAEAVLERIGWLATWFRNTYRMPFQTSIEGFAPYWFREFLKVDIERKINRAHNPVVTDADVERYLLAWGVKLQWVYDWQDFPSTEYTPPYDDVQSSHIMPRGGWPNAVDIVLYPAGSWVLAEQNIIRLDATYDSNRLRNNRFTKLFLEDAWMLLNRCSRSFVVQLRGLCANGATGDAWQACEPDPIPARREEITTGQGQAPTNPPPPQDGKGQQPPPPPQNPPANGGNGRKKS